jgi:peptidoglycan/xylan/chitin deacetylase (PgdA/CDA1 family)
MVAVGTAMLMLLGACGSASAGANGASPRPRRTSASPSPSPTAQGRVAAFAGSPRSGDGPSGSLRSTGTAAVALTFDDGPSPTWTPRILALLRKYHVHATFCVIGREARAYPQLVRQIVEQGHTLCNHSWDHDEFLYQRSAAYIRTEMTRTNAAIRRAVPGASIRYYRQPGGNWSARIVRQARALGMTPLHWSVDPSDWRRPPARSIVATVKSTTRKGSIILDHDGGGDRSHTYAALRVLLPYLRRKYDLIRL